MISPGSPSTSLVSESNGTPDTGSSTQTSTPNSWQQSKSITECLSYMLEQEIGCDVTFSFTSPVGRKDHVCAHRLLLAARSPVFESMFCGHFAEAQAKPVVIPVVDVDISAFKEMLRYLYSDTVTINHENVMYLIFLSQKYMIDALTLVCCQYLENTLSMENVCTITEQATNFNLLLLVEKCISYIIKNFSVVMQCENFMELSQKNLLRIISSDFLDANQEEDVFLACVDWASCNISKIKSTAVVTTDSDPGEGSSNVTTARTVLGDCLYQIRFSCIPAAQMSRLIGQCDVLTSEEKLYLYHHDHCKNDVKGFNMNKRFTHRYSFNRCTMVSTSHEFSDPHFQRFYFTPDKPIKFVGVSILGSNTSSNSGRDLSVQIWLLATCTKTILCEETVRIKQHVGPNSPLNVHTKKICPINADQRMRIRVRVSGQSTAYATYRDGNCTVRKGGVSFLVENRKSSQLDECIGNVLGIIFVKDTDFD